MDQAAMIAYIPDTFGGVDIIEKEGDYFFFYDPGQGLTPDYNLPFATMVTNDNYDTVSDLGRPGVYRLNIGVSPETFRSLLKPADAVTGEPEAEATYDYTAFDQFMPHPDYGKMFWLCILNPSSATLETVTTLLAEAYDRARQRDERTRAATSRR